MENPGPSDAPNPDAPTPDESARHAPLRPADPEKIGPYSLVARLGEGGMGTVYLAESPDAAHSHVALKVIKRGMDTHQVLARFDAEQNALSLLDHPNIARILESGETEQGQPYFVMEYVDGVPIDEYCRDHRVSLADRLHLVQEVCAGVQHAHTKGIVHRDLKPRNILIAIEDGRPVPKVIDFGLAKALNRTLTEWTLATTAEQFIGTFEYMSPEQARSRGADVDTKTDVYAIGVILYELLVDRPPFEELWRHMDSEIVEIIVERDPPAPSQRIRQLEAGVSRVLAEARGLDRNRFIASLRGEIDWIVLKALEKDRDRRYETPLALAADLGRHLSGEEPVHARPPSAVYNARKFVRRYRGFLGSAALVLLALVVGLSWALAERHRTEVQMERVLRLSDLRRLRELRAEAETLFPIAKWTVPAMEDWLGRARTLHHRLPLHRAVLDTATPETEEELWESELLGELVDELERFGGRDGRIAEVSGRREWALGAERITLHEPEAAAAWERAIASIADETECPLYDGLEITPQLGLIPLDRNPRTGLWEFWHPHSGQRPEPNQDHDPDVPGRASRWTITDDTAIVFVLIPGGNARVGAENPPIGGLLRVEDGALRVGSVEPGGLIDRAGILPGDIILELNGVDLRFLGEGSGLHMQRPYGDARGTLHVGSPARFVVDRDGDRRDCEAVVEIGTGSPHIDPWVAGQAGPVQEVELAPFFIAKYEMTQAQWSRLPARERFPSQRITGNEVGRGVVLTPVHPVESVSWTMCSRLVGRCGLALPTEAQWEYATRAGTTTIYWSGDRWQDLHGVANISDPYVRLNRSRDPGPDEIEDGFRVHAPVGSFRANPFGLHDVHGNVSELCRDCGEVYREAPPAPLSGDRASGVRRTQRGGGFDNGATRVTSAKRYFTDPNHRSGTTGLRPSRPILTSTDDRPMIPVGPTPDTADLRPSGPDSDGSER